MIHNPLSIIYTRSRTTDHRSQIGFTLIEAVVSTSVFAFIVTSVIGVYIATVQLDSKTRAQRAVTQNARFIMEFMAKEVRNGLIDYSRYPGGLASGTVSDLYVQNQANEQERIFLSGSDLALSKPAGTTNLNSGNVLVTDVKFLVTPAGNPLTITKAYNQQPSVTIILELTSVFGSGTNDSSKVRLQSTYSTRSYPSRQ